MTLEAMECPACSRQLKKISISGVALDVCQDGCGGVWFDAYELKRLDEQHEAAGEELLDIPVNPSVKVDHSQLRLCPNPACSGMKMWRHFFSVKREVEVDECPKCGGHWLDEGELTEIRKQFATDEERSKAAKECLGAAFEAEFAKIRAENAEKVERGKNIANIFRFILPTYYLPGKQDWGAY